MFSPFTSHSDPCEACEGSVTWDCPSIPSSHGLLAKPCGNPNPSTSAVRGEQAGVKSVQGFWLCMASFYLKAPQYA